MSRLAPNLFASYEFTEEEQRQALQYTTLQKQHLQNEIAGYAVDKNNLEPNPENYSKYLQQEAYLRGKMDALIYLLEVIKISAEDQELEL